MLKRVLMGATLLALAGISAPVASSASLGQCDTNYMCVWGNNNYEWLIAKQYHGTSSWVDPFNNDTGENNQADSYANYSGTYTGCLADGAEGAGDKVTMPRGGRDDNLAYWNSDEASSMRTANGC